MLSFDNPKQVIGFMDDLSRAASVQRRQLAWTIGVSMCYVEGSQWISSRWNGIQRGVDRLRTNNDPDSVKLISTDNITGRNVQKIAAHTHPTALYMDVTPPERDTSTEGAYGAQVHESVINCGVDQTGLLRKAQVANIRRATAGVWGLGLGIMNGTRWVGNQEIPDRSLYAYEFNPSNLILDPVNQSGDLIDHECVAYTDIWTADAIEANYGIKLNRDKLQAIKNLDPSIEKMDSLSDRRLFSRYTRYSETKGARITQLHCKDASGCFGTWYVILDAGDEDKRIINDNDIATPFGGYGMPFTLLHAYGRPDSMWSWGDAEQMRGDQDRINLASTLFWRICQKNAGFQWIVDRRFFGGKSGKDGISQELTNQVGGIIVGDTRGRNEGINPPQLVQHPEPSVSILGVMDRYKIGAREKLHISEGMEGHVPTHVPTKNFQASREDAGQVISVRINNDLRSYEYIVKVMHGTMIKLAQEKVPGVLAALSEEAGFDEQDFSVIVMADSRRPAVQVELRESTVRHISAEAKKQNLDYALANQAITAEQYQLALADSLDMPLTDSTRQMLAEARKAALRVVLGEDYEPMPWGEWNNIIIGELLRAQFDRRAKADPATRQRLVVAVQSQYQMWFQEKLMANPELQAKLMGSGQPVPQGEAPQQPTGPDQGADLADVLDALSRGGSGAGAPVPASAA